MEVHFDRDDSELCDYSGIHALSVVGEKYKKYDKKLYVRGLDMRSKRMLSKSKKLNRHFSLVDEASRPLVKKMFWTQKHCTRVYGKINNERRRRGQVREEVG